MVSRPPSRPGSAQSPRASPAPWPPTPWRLERYGRLDLKRLLLPAAAIAESGFAIDRVYARNLCDSAPQLARLAGSRAVLLKDGGAPYEEGEVLRQPDLARTYRAIAAEGPEWFYRGPFAAQLGRWMAQNGGLLTAGDLAGYQAQLRAPVITTYRRYTVVGFPPPSSGGVHVAQMLNMLERFDLKALQQRDPALLDHVLVEAMKRAFADRAHWLGDPDFADVPRGLIDKGYAAALARGIDLEHATRVPAHGLPPRWQTDHIGRHTTHVAAADGEGTWVGITATVNTSFGSKAIVPGTGVVLNNQMDDFSIAPGMPNQFGLIGSDANAIAPGKRPLSSMSPTIVLCDGRPVLTLGAAGGPQIITQVVSTLVRHLDLGMDLEAALAAPRLHHQWLPDSVLVDRDWDPRARGARGTWPSGSADRPHCSHPGDRRDRRRQIAGRRTILGCPAGRRGFKYLAWPMIPAGSALCCTSPVDIIQGSRTLRIGVPAPGWLNPRAGRRRRHGID